MSYASANRNRKERYYRRKKEGICVNCLTEAVEGLVSCQRCREKRSKLMKLRKTYAKEYDSPNKDKRH